MTPAHRRLASLVATINPKSFFRGAPSMNMRLTWPLRASFCSATKVVAAPGMQVKVEYTGTLQDGTPAGRVFDTSEGKEPLVFTVGGGKIIAGFDEGVIGMCVGESKELRMEPAKAYGEVDPRGIQEVPKDKLPEGVEIGAELQTGDGARAVVTKIIGDTATVDMNHPLAGKILNFSIKLVGCEQAPSVEIKTITEGDGKTFPKQGDRLTMHYTGSLASNGEKFDSSVDRGEPFEFQIGVGQVIQGWDEGVMKMSVGQKATLHIPSAMGYGQQGAGGKIPPNADLVFEVELIKIGD